ncbi:hypothetical protein [Pseudoalteromonas sp. SWN166]|uniref:hypothetical protein n=1 Tax=Pseudoalteromonas sp. SWN166 TaxID=2792061 RepID=UPI0018CE88C3|nr:hypothetical protein [Pseudoalteromonas sp. SWN166]MBH0040232.1 hypothetical protein [Pseudoalteromonas sp. SWN166]
MVVPFTKFTTKKWVVLASKIDQLFIGIGINSLNVAKGANVRINSKGCTNSKIKYAYEN